MKHSLFAGLLLSSMAITAGAAGCSGDDTVANNPGVDAGKDTAASNDAQSADTGTGATDAGSDAGERCSAAKEQLLKPIDTVSTGDVNVYATEGNAQRIYVNASAGGLNGASTNPRIYLKLASTKVAVTDKSAGASADWDLALKRDVIFTNSGDGGKGQGSALFLADKPFDEVTVADTQGKTFDTENFFDDNCTPKRDEFGSVKTTFSGWYDYNDATHVLTPKEGTFLVRTAAGAFFKLQILSYYSTADGGTGMAGGHFTFKVGAL
ncbi:HmuY family protein [Pendulispora brunnea]|uniref:HmuY family protein n=1 Tax=Pendulispora brunnea TaxID=2905690 RepID=A0ABZ2K114_9BACT